MKEDQELLNILSLMGMEQEENQGVQNTPKKLDEPEDPYALDNILRSIEDPPPPCDDLESRVERVLKVVKTADEVYLRERLLPYCTKEFLDLLVSNFSKRGNFVRDTMLTKGSVTRWDMLGAGYDPVAVCDLTSLGVTVSTKMISEKGKSSMEYTLNPQAFIDRAESRMFMTPKERRRFFRSYGCKCLTCSLTLDPRSLQVDHRIPFILVGNSLVKLEGYSALKPACPSCNSTREDICRECIKKRGTNHEVLECRTCYWAYPENYTHIAGTHRSLILVASTRDDPSKLEQVREFALSIGLDVST
jgi:hypothetical protein